MHDTLFVHHCFKLHWKWLLHQHLVWFDGPTSQIKAKQSFYFIGRYPSKTRLEMR